MNASYRKQTVESSSTRGSCLNTRTTLLAIMLLLPAPGAVGQSIFQDGFERFEFLPLPYVAVWQEYRGNPDKTQIISSGLSPDFNDQVMNPVASGYQLFPDIGVAADGSFVVVWQDDADGNGLYQIRARGFYADGSQRFAMITVNSVASGQQLTPAIGVADDGRFVVVWDDDLDENGLTSILARGFNANGSERFADRRIDNEGAGNQEKPAIAMAGNGDFVVSWEDDQNRDSIYEIAVRAFNSNGTAKFPQLTVNTNTAGPQFQGDVAIADNGDFVVVWTDDSDYNHFTQIHARGFFANGSQRFAVRTVNQVAPGSQYEPAVGMSNDGRFVAAWVDQSQRLVSRNFAANGNTLSGDIVLNDNRLLQQIQPAIAVSANGRFVVIWSYLGADGRIALAGRHLDFSGQTGPQVNVSSNNSYDQILPRVGIR